MCASAGVKRKASPEDTAEAVKRTKVDDVQESSDGTYVDPIRHQLCPNASSLSSQ